jgi:formylglycine-generating enzyme required for sulfatase activity
MLLVVAGAGGQDHAGFEAYTFIIPNSDVAIEMVPVQGGAFTMFDPDKVNESGTSFEVKVDSFWMSRHAISWQQYDLFVNEMETRLSEKQPGLEKLRELGIEPDAISVPSQPYLDVTFGFPTEGYPAINITHYAAVAYAKWLTALTGDFYRLPTEAEWEYACRAGASGDRYEMQGGTSRQEAPGRKSDLELLLDEHEWYAANVDNRYGPVAEKKANDFGLKDMMGNVAEWTMDQYFTDYHQKVKSGSRINPWFYPSDLYPRALRGGSWKDPADMIRCTTRRGSDPDWSRSDPQLPRSSWWHSDAPFIGFRLVRPFKKPAAEEIEKFWIDEIPDF